MNRTLSLLAVMTFLATPVLAAEITAPPVAIPAAPGSSNDPTATTIITPGQSGTPGDYTTMSVADLQVAAEKGDPKAQFQLGEHFGQHNSLDADYSVAAKWYEKSANQGNKEAQYKLGLLYRDALGVTQSAAVAYFWVSLATQDSTTKSWLAAREDLEKQLKPEQVAAVKTKVAAWKPVAPGADPAEAAPAAPAPAAPSDAPMAVPAQLPQ